MKNLFARLRREEAGQTVAEYAILLALIVVIALVSIKLLGNNVNNQLNNVAGNLK